MRIATFASAPGARVDIYVDGTFRGTVSPMGDLLDVTLSGPTRLYAHADFDDGSALNWGPWMVPCRTAYTWKLTS